MIVNREKLSTILEKHKHWINEDCEGWEAMKADLCDADLCGANLCGANLCNADLRGAYLCDADLRDANLINADLRGAYLYDADLCGANLCGVNLINANLCGANLINADLRGADLRCADLRGANLINADLRDANLINADLDKAKIYNANLHDANLNDVKNLPFIPYVCPVKGSFIGYKKARQKIIKLEIPEDAHRTSATTRKCRCNKAKVLGIYDYENNLLEDKEVASNRDKNFIYRVGEIVEVKDFDEDRWHECSTGIHFFINFEEAVKY